MPVSVTAISIACPASRSTGWLGSSRWCAVRTAASTLAIRGELEGVGQQVEHHLLQPLLVGADRVGQGVVEIDLEREALFRRQLAEGAFHMLLERGQRHVAKLDRHRAGLDLRQVEDVVDQAEQIGAGAMDRARELGLLFVEVALLVVGQQLRQDQQRVQRRAQLVAHVGQEFGLVFRGQRELLGLFLDRAAGHVDLEVLGLDLPLLVLEQLRFFLQFLVGVVQLFLLGRELGLARLQLLRQQLRFLEQLLGPHGRGDRVEHDADGFHQLVEEAVVGLVELLERRAVR